jgi:hypothetical protein
MFCYDSKINKKSQPTWQKTEVLKIKVFFILSALYWLSFRSRRILVPAKSKMRRIAIWYRAAQKTKHIIIRDD